MTGLVRKAALLSMGGLLVAASAMATVPSPANSVVPCAISLVGTNGANTAADPLGQFTVVVRDVGNVPLSGVVVAVDLASCCNDIRLDTVQLGAGVTINAAVKQVYATTDVTGTATFRIMGGASNSLPTGGTGGCARVYAGATLLTDGISLVQPAVSCYDLNATLVGGRGVGGADLSLWFADFGASGPPLNQYRQRADYDRKTLCVANVGGADLAKWFALFGALGSNSVAATAYVACP